MRKVLKYIVGKTYRPFLLKYLSKTRVYRYNDVVVEVPPGVFHPRFFFSTKLLLSYLNGVELPKKRFLELGAGSGLISICASKQGAEVTAIDINPLAIKALAKNRLLNKTGLEIIESDLFDALEGRQFDIIAINPPYYKKKPKNFAEYAWYCGEKGEYFTRLFQSLNKHVKPGALVTMILCDGCDIDMIQQEAEINNFKLKPVYTKKNLLEKNTIYQLEIADE